MGVHICCFKNGTDHPEWDYIRYANDDKFVRLFKDIELHFLNDGFPNSYFRPKNTQCVRDKILEQGWENEERYFHLMDILDSDENSWLYFSF